jgi:hypothetical protein
MPEPTNEPGLPGGVDKLRISLHDLGAVIESVFKLAIDPSDDPESLSRKLPQVFSLLEDLRHSRTACMRQHRVVTVELAKALDEGSTQGTLSSFERGKA